VDRLTDLLQFPSAVALPILLGAGALFLLLLVMRAIPVRAPRYAPQPGLFSPAEWAFFQALDAAVGSDRLIFAKVRIADLVTPVKTGNRRAWWRAFAKISSKHVDYVIADRRTGAIRLAIELDDRSHARQDRKDRDDFVDLVFAQAGIALLRIPASRGYDRRNLADRIAAAIAGARSKSG
jgi:hypothetical protein